MTTIDEALRTRLLQPSLIKIDVEGFEEHVLRGAEGTIREYSPILAFECDSEEQFRKCREVLSASWDFYHIFSDVKPALRKVDQVVPVARSLLTGSRTYVSKVGAVSGYLSLVFAVEKGRQELFERAIASLRQNGVAFS